MRSPNPGLIGSMVFIKTANLSLFDVLANPDGRLEDSIPESMVQTQRLEHSIDPAEFLLFSKSYFLRDKINWLQAQIKARNKLLDENLNKIESGVIYFDTKLMKHDDRWRNLMDLRADIARSALEKEISNLEREKRMEILACWKDTAALKEKLLDTIREYELAKNRLDVLTKNGNGGTMQEAKAYSR